MRKKVWAIHRIDSDEKVGFFLIFYYPYYRFGIFNYFRGKIDMEGLKEIHMKRGANK